MKKLMVSVSILLFIVTLSAQELIINQTEELNIVEIGEKAKTDAKADFDKTKKRQWGSFSTAVAMGTALAGNMFEEELDKDIQKLLVGGMISVPIIALLTPTDLPENRQEEIAKKNQDYQELYCSEYTSTIRIQRFKYSLLGPTSCLSSAAIIGIITFLAIFTGILIVA